MSSCSCSASWSCRCWGGYDRAACITQPGQQVVMQLAHPFDALRNAAQCRTEARACANVGYHTFFCMQCTWNLHVCADPDVFIEELHTMTGCITQCFKGASSGCGSSPSRRRSQRRSRMCWQQARRQLRAVVAAVHRHALQNQSC